MHYEGKHYVTNLLLSFDFIMLRAFIEKLLVHFHEQLEGVIDETVNRSVREIRNIIILNKSWTI